MKTLELPGLWEVFPCKVSDTDLVHEPKGNLLSRVGQLLGSISERSLLTSFSRDRDHHDIPLRRAPPVYLAYDMKATGIRLGSDTWLTGHVPKVEGTQVAGRAILEL